MSYPVCKICSANTSVITDDQFDLLYYSCGRCGFIFTDDKSYLTAEKEREHYLKHDNSFESEGYVHMFREFIKTAIEPFNNIGRALDFGCGHGPVLAELLREKGIRTDIYDKYFADDGSFRNNQYDLITATEVVEHLNDPIDTLKLLVGCLSTKGILAIMTRFHPENDDIFKDWWYRRDDTHISFYSPRTFHHIAKTFNMKLLLVDDKNIVVMQKQ